MHFPASKPQLFHSAESDTRRDINRRRERKAVALFFPTRCRVPSGHMLWSNIVQHHWWSLDLPYVENLNLDFMTFFPFANSKCDG